MPFLPLIINGEQGNELVNNRLWNFHVHILVLSHSVRCTFANQVHLGCMRTSKIINKTELIGCSDVKCKHIVFLLGQATRCKSIDSSYKNNTKTHGKVYSIRKVVVYIDCVSLIL